MTYEPHIAAYLKRNPLAVQGEYGNILSVVWRKSRLFGARMGNIGLSEDFEFLSNDA